MLNKNRIDLEKKYGIFKPYKNNDQLSSTWEKIIKKCVFLRNLNHKNKILMNKNFYLNQQFLESFSQHKLQESYNIKGDLK